MVGADRAGTFGGSHAHYSAQAGRVRECDPGVEQHSQVPAPRSLPYRPRSRDRGLQEISSGVHGSRGRGHPAREAGTACVARSLAETGSWATSVSHLPARICHA